MLDQGIFGNADVKRDAKRTLIEAYFIAWAPVMVNRHNEHVTFVDLATGSGGYDSGKPSAPIMVLAGASANQGLKASLVAVFNEKNPQKLEALKESCASVPDVEGLRNPPRFGNFVDEAELIGFLKKGPLSPCLSFVDLWAYGDLTLNVVDTLLAGVWGCDCFFFLDYARLDANSDSETAEQYLVALFGEKHANALREEFSGMSPDDHELHLVNALGEELEARCGKYVIPFKMRTGRDRDLWVFFVSKHYDGYEVMKTIIAMESKPGGKPRFAYAEVSDQTLGLLYGFSPKQERLRNQLLRTFAGQFLSVRQIHSKHNMRTRYIKEDYQKGLLKLERKALVTCSPAERRQNTMADNVMVTFPAVFVPIKED